MKHSIRISGAALLLMLFTSVANAGPINGFTGIYDVSTWTTQTVAATVNTTQPGTVGTGGSVDTSGAPLVITMNEPNNGGGWNYEIQFLNTAAGDGIFSFDWAISGSDFCCGSANVYIGDTTATGWNDWSTDTSDVLWGGGTTSGSFSGAILAGQDFGFGVATADDCCGSIVLTITNFSAPGAVPEPSALFLLGAGLLGLVRNRKPKFLMKG